MTTNETTSGKSRETPIAPGISEVGPDRNCRAFSPAALDRSFHIALPNGGEVICYPGDRDHLVMEWNKHGDAGNTVGVFSCLSAAIAAGRKWAAAHYGVTA